MFGNCFQKLFVRDRVDVCSISEIGKLHTNNGTPIQDSSFSWKKGRGFFIAVSDGHGSPVHFKSQIGSKLACEASFSIYKGICKKYNNGKLKKLKNSKLEMDQFLIETENQIISLWNKMVEDDVKNNDFRNDEKYCSLSNKDKSKLIENSKIAYGCTLLVAYRFCSLTIILKIGDGNIIVADKQNKFYEPPELEDKSNFLNITSSLCTFDCLKHFRHVVFNDDIFEPNAIFLFSDGVVNSFSSPKMLAQFAINISKMAVENDAKSTATELKQGLRQCSMNGSGDDASCAFAIDKSKLKNICEKLC